ncbi:contactin-associated protein-like 2 [Montipora capricornis]|uniref:contactin-associated protein-like 2 n=1 Tax=Montipora capricornis TaxID=246305 RepID=UPI0035F1FC1A
MYRLRIFLTLFYSPLSVLAVQGNTQCRESGSQRGVALRHAVYSSKIIQRYFDCVNECINDPPCVSINFWWHTRKCDLNYKTKEHSCRACLVAEPHSTYMGIGKLPGNRGYANSCTALKTLDPTSNSGVYVIDPDGEGGLPPFDVTCDMTDKNGVGVTVISHDSENRTRVKGCDPAGCYKRDIHYSRTTLSQLEMLTRVSSDCEQFIMYECYHAVLFRYKEKGAWWMSHDSKNMTHWGGASAHNKCACGMTNSCADSRFGCNCDKNDKVWREDSGLLTHKTQLPVSQLRFGDTRHDGEEGYHTLGKFKCYGTA